MKSPEVLCCPPERPSPKNLHEAVRPDPSATKSQVDVEKPDHLPRIRELGTSSSQKLEQVVLEADEITFKVGNVVLSMTKKDGGTLEIRAPRIRLLGEDIISEADGTNTIVGENVVTEASFLNDLLGKLIRIDGQCVRINS